MKNSSLRFCVVALLFMAPCGAALLSQTPKAFESAEGLVSEIYQSVSFDSAGPMPESLVLQRFGEVLRRGEPIRR